MRYATSPGPFPSRLPVAALGSGWVDAGMSTFIPHARICSGYSCKIFFDMSKAPTELTIGALSEQTGVNVETIRYYEREGLLPSSPRTAGGHRVFD
jgi:hypothetical protein